MDFESVVPCFNATDPSKAFSDASVMRGNSDRLNVANESLKSLLKRFKKVTGHENATSSDFSDDAEAILKNPSVVRGGSKCCDCYNRQTKDISSQLEDLNLRLKIQVNFKWNHPLNILYIILKY